MNVRRQLTLFVPAQAAVDLERVRAIVDPVQHALIAAHVTLCREDEIGARPVAALERSIAEASQGPLTLSFGRPEPFSGHGILLNCIAGQADFDGLRERILGSREVVKRTAHVTLAHPRNPKASAHSLETAASLPSESTWTLSKVSLIEQSDAQPWRVLHTFDLAVRPAASSSTLRPVATKT